MLSRSEDLALLTGRLFVAALFLPSGFHKLVTFSAYVALLKAKGLPFPFLWAVVMVAAEFVGPVALLIGLWPRWTALVLIALTLATAWTTYRFGMFGAPFRQPQQLQAVKSAAVIAGLLFYAVSGPGAWSRTGLRRG